MPDGMDRCVSRVQGASGGKLDKERANDLLGRAEERAERLRRESGGTLSYAEAYQKAAEEISGEDEQAAAIARRNAIENLQKRIERRARLDKNGIRGAREQFRAELHGVNTPQEGGRFSAQAEWHALANEWINSGMTAELDRAGLFKVARDGALDEQVAQEMGELTKGTDGKPGISGSEPAEKIARVFNRYLSLAKESLNDAGAWIGDYFGYVAHTSHDSDAIRRAGREKWIADTMPLLDRERTFEGVEHPGQLLPHIWDNLVTGVHMRSDAAFGFKDPAFTGPGNAAKRLSQGRVLHWKDAQSWLAYQRLYGEKHIVRAVLHTLNQSARWTAIMRRWGTNPRADFEGDLRWLEARYNHEDPDGVIKFRQQEQSLWNRFDTLDGTANIPVNRLWSRLANYVRLDESLSLLGNIAFTHLSVGMTRAAELWHHGISPFESYKDYVQAYAAGRGRGEAREVYRQLGAAADGAIADLINRFDLSDGVPGVASAIAANFMRWTGLTYLYDAQKGALQALLSYQLGRNLDTDFAGLAEPTQRMLGMYGVGEREWELLRNASERLTVKGKTYLVPRDALRISDDDALVHLRAIGALEAPDRETELEDAQQQLDYVPMVHKPGITEAEHRAINRFRSRLGTKLHAYLVDSAERGMIQPGIEERAILLQGTRPGTVTGELARFFAQFKVWPTALVTKGLGREVYTSPTWTGAAVGLTQMALAGAVFGYIRMFAADLSEGKTPRDPKNPKTWGAAFAQGGGLGILGDFLFGQYNRFGQDLTTTAAGPVATDANVIYNIFLKAKEGKNPSPMAFNFLVNHIPYSNLFYLHAALDYLIVWRINELMRPGWARRYQETIEKQNAQTFWLSPAAAVR